MSTPLRRHRADEAERLVRQAQGVAAAALSETVRLRRALDALTLAVQIYDEGGTLVLHNRQHGELETNRQVAALVAAAVERLVGEAAAGEPASETLVLHGPPPRTLDITAVPLDSDGRALGTIAFIEDISERRRLEAVRRDFAANVSHELRTPIGALAVLAETLAVEDDPAVTQRLVSHITTEAERAGRLIEDLLDLSRIEAEGVLTEELVDTNAVTDTAADRVLPLARQRQVEIVVAPAQTALLVRGDERQLVSAVANLLDNAVKYSEPGSKVEVGASRSGSWARIAVRDQGIGIPAKDLSGSSSASTGSTGPAAGRPAAPGWGWRSSATSPPTTAATSSSAPARARAPPSPSASPWRPRDGAPMSLPVNDSRPMVLVVEDEESFVEALSLGLSREGFAVRVARDGAEALEQFEAERPDVVLLDLMLPRVSGIDVCRHIRARSSIPIIMVTAKDSEVDAVVGLEVGADDYVTKPYRLRELVARVRAVLRRATPGPEAEDDDEDSAEVLEVGDVTLDPGRHRVTVRDGEVALPLREFELLELLLANAGRVLTRDTLIDRIWGPNYVGDTKTLDVHVKRLRSKIEDNPSRPSRITTIRGLGYRYEKPARV